MNKFGKLLSEDTQGVILAGGTGSRMHPLTKVVNKHLLPIGNKPMIQHCIEKMTEVGITEIMIITGGEHLGGIAEFCGSGKDFGCDFTFRVQDRAGGIAEALGLTRGFVRDRMFVLLGDNMFESDLGFAFDAWSDCINQGRHSMVVLKEVSDPERFGVAELGKPMEVVAIEEKPVNPKSNFAVTGLYFYDVGVYNIIDGLEPSERDELEITDVNNAHISDGQLGACVLPGWWTDAGTHESYARANKLARKSKK